jgi:hypothetical protein
VEGVQGGGAQGFAVGVGELLGFVGEGAVGVGVSHEKGFIL